MEVSDSFINLNRGGQSRSAKTVCVGDIEVTWHVVRLLPTSPQGQRGPRSVSWDAKSYSPPDTECHRCGSRPEIVHARHAVGKKPKGYDPFAGGLLLGSGQQARLPSAPSLSLFLSLPLLVSAFACGEEEEETAPLLPTLPRFPDLPMPLAKVEHFLEQVSVQREIHPV